ncbi:MAG: hypothetical protein KGD63_01340 [Candidatus Lokiarchaeota archaeon]|nr:hypothetical protein [Candidatus Lokiarchaeota archaeon]
MVQYYKKLNSAVLEKLKLLIGKDNYFDDLETRWTYAFGGIPFQGNINFPLRWQ